jgi:hypothetical protein
MKPSGILSTPWPDNWNKVVGADAEEKEKSFQNIWTCSLTFILIDLIKLKIG